MNRKDENLAKTRALKFFVKIYAKASRAQLDRENAGINLGYCRMRAEDLGLQNPKVPIPWFSKDLISPDAATSAGAAVFDVAFWRAVREAKGDPEEVWLEDVWQLFASNVIAARSGISAVFSGLEAMKGLAKGRRARWGDTNKRLRSVQASFDEQRRRCPDRSNNLLIRLAAEKCAVSQSFIREHVRKHDLIIPPKP